MRVFCDRELRIEGNKRKNVLYDARRSIEEAVNKISGEYYFCVQQMLIILVLGR